MKKFATGLLLGLCLGITVTASAAKLVGDSGFLMGWDVTVGGETVCSDPYVWPGVNEIECD